jgi:hypothetical protein
VHLIQSFTTTRGDCESSGISAVPTGRRRGFLVAGGHPISVTDTLGARQVHVTAYQRWQGNPAILLGAGGSRRIRTKYVFVWESTMRLTAVFCSAVLAFAPLASGAKGGGNGGAGSRPSYGGGTHTSSHGGTYRGGHGASHKGGTYRNPASSDRYGTHK